MGGLNLVSLLPRPCGLLGGYVQAASSCVHGDGGLERAAEHIARSRPRAHPCAVGRAAVLVSACPHHIKANLQ